MVAIVGVLLGLALLYFWLRGHWFAAVVAMLAVWAGPGLLLAEGLTRNGLPAPLSLTIGVGAGAIAWIPYAIHRTRRLRLAAPVIAPQPITGITLASRDASFNG